MIRPLEEGGSGNGDAAQILLKGADGRAEEKRGRGEEEKGQLPKRGRRLRFANAFPPKTKSGH